MANIKIQDKDFINTLTTGSLILIQTDPLVDGTYYKLSWGTFSGVILNNYVENYYNNQPKLLIGSGNPTGLALSAPSGSLYTDWSAGIVYMKSGDNTNGWF